MKKFFSIIIQTIFVMFIATKSVSASVSLNYKEIYLGVNVTQQLKLTGDISGEVSWSSSNNNVVIVNNGSITGISVGTAYITANNGIYSDTCKVMVVNNYVAINSISLPSISGTILKNDTRNINATLNPTNASNKKIFYYSSDPSIVSVDSVGNLTGYKVGTAYITLVAEYKSASYKVSVVDSVGLQSISISPTKITLDEGNTEKLNVSFSPSNATNKGLSWKSSDTKVVTVDNSGNIKAISAGEATITATSSDGGYTASSKVTVNALDKTLKGISLDKEELTMQVNDTKTLSVIYNPSNAENKEVKWSSSNNRIVKVENGTVTAVKPGKAEIKATSKEGNFEVICAVTVLSPPIESIAFENTEQTVYVGTITELNTISTPENTMINNPIWTSSDEEVATIEDGKLTALKVGKTIITVSDTEGKITASTEITVTEAPEETLNITIVGYELNFDPNTKNYTLQIKNESSLDIRVNRDDKKVTIGGNRDLQDGSIITVTINEKQKTTYVINIKKKKSNYLYFIIIITLLLFINIIRIMIKNKKKSKQ